MLGAGVVSELVGGELRWSRFDGLEVRGWVLEGPILERVNGRLAALGLPDAKLVDPRPSPLSAANRLAIIEALFHTVIAEVEVMPNRGVNVDKDEREGLVLVRGAFITEADELAMRRELEKTVGLRVVVELDLANPLIEPGPGQLVLGSKYSSRLRKELFESSVVRGADGQVVATDGVGRIAPGRYGLDDGTFARVHAGHRTLVNPDGPAILVEGRRYRLGWGVKRVVGPGEAEALRVTGKVGVRAQGEGLERSVARLVIGADFAATSAEGHARLVGMGRPVHFLIDFDGTVFQTLDLAELAAGMPADEIHIALNNRLIPGGAAWPERHARRAEMLGFERSGPEFAVISEEASRGELSDLSAGELTTLHGYTFEQVWVLGVLARRLVELFPRLGAGFVWGSDRLSPFSPAERVERAEDGIFLASQLDPKRWDPGPALDLRKVMARLSEESDPVAPRLDGVVMAKTVLSRVFEPTCREVLWADPRAQLARLRADPGSTVFRETFHVDWFRRDEMFDQSTVRLMERLGIEPGDVVFDVRRATAGELTRGAVEGFPGELSEVAEHLQPDSEWFVWKVGDPARPEEARVGHGLVRAEGQWYLLPEPWSWR